MVSLEVVYEARLRALRAMVSQNVFNLGNFCAFYSVTPAIVAKMLGIRTEELEKYESDSPIQYDSLTDAVYLEIRRAEKQGIPVEDTLAKFGLVLTPAKEHVPWDNCFCELTEEMAETVGIPIARTSEDIWDFNNEERKALLLKWLRAERVTVINKITGRSEATLVRFCKQNGMKPILTRTNTNAGKRVTKISQERTLSNIRRLEKAECAWNMHREGMTKRQIADALGVSDHHTVTDYIRLYEETHPELVDKTQLYAKRNMGVDVVKKHKELVDNFDLLVDAGMTPKDACALLGKTEDLINHSRVVAYRPSDNVTLVANKTTRMESRQGYKHANERAVWKDGNDGERHLYKSPTQYICDKLNVPYAHDPESHRARELAKAHIVRDQKKLMVKLRANAEMYEAWEQSKGNLDKALRASR